MSHSREKAEQFLKTCSSAIVRLYKQIPTLRRERETLAERIRDLDEHCKKVRGNATVNIPYERSDPNQPTAFQKLVWVPLKAHEQSWKNYWIKGVERKPAGFVQRHDLAINYAVIGQVWKGTLERGVTGREIISIAGHKTRAAAALDTERA